jgi:hypothetical protein
MEWMGIGENGWISEKRWISGKAPSIHPTYIKNTPLGFERGV